MSWLRKRSAPAADHGANEIADLFGMPSSKKSASSWVRPVKRLTRRHTPLDTDPPVDKLTGQMLKTGQTLEQFAKHIVHCGVLKMGRPSFKGSMTVASMCHGSAMDVVALHALGEALQAQDIPVSFTCILSCEIEPKKRLWCQRVLDKLDPNGDACVMDDMTKICNGTATCSRHNGQKCTLNERVDGLIVGFSCKDASKANQNRSKLASTLFTSSTSPGKTNDTVVATLNFIDKHLPEWILLENSDTLDESDHVVGLELLLSELASRGYDPMPFLIDGSEYALPQIRKRMYILCLLRPGRRFKISNYELLNKRVGELLLHFKLGSPSLLESLLSSDHDCVAKELEIRQASGPSKGWESSSIDIHRKAWQKEGKRWAASKASQEDQDSPWWKSVNARARDILALNQHTNRGEDQAFRLIGCDLSQSPGRASTTVLNGKGQLSSPTILPKSFVWISHPGFHRPILGVESMMLQGWPILHPRWQEHLALYSNDNAMLQSLAGNAFPGTVIQAILAAMLFGLDFEVEEKLEDVCTSAEAIASAFDLLNSCNKT